MGELTILKVYTKVKLLICEIWPECFFCYANYVMLETHGYHVTKVNMLKNK